MTTSTRKETVDILLAGRWVRGEDGALHDANPYDDAPVAEIGMASRAQVERAIEEAGEAWRSYRKMPAHRRSAMLRKTSDLIAERAEDLARTIAMEVGKPMGAARVEVSRTVNTFRIASEEAAHIYGETVPMDAVNNGEGRQGILLRQPIGVVTAITPFNFPLNLVAHKVAPALAAGNAVINKPATACALTAIMLGRILLEAGVPEGVVSVLPASNEAAEPLITSDGIAMVSFTGSVPVGKRIREMAGLKRVTLELGSNSANVITPSADLDRAAGALAQSGFSFAGQSCISAQRIYVHESRMEDFLARFVPEVEALKVGDPLEDDTDVGPMISERDAERIVEWIEEARAAGAQVLTGGTRQKAIVRPTVLRDAPAHCRVIKDEVFAPVVTVVPYRDFDEAIAMVNDSRYGLNAGLFTNDLSETLRAVEGMEVGTVVVNDVSSYRADHMPYGGVKESGLGREGLRYAIEEMTEIKFAVIRA